MEKYLLSDGAFLDALTERAKRSERLRMHYDLRDSAEDRSMRMLNALEPGTVIPVHRHNDTSEDVVCFLTLSLLSPFSKNRPLIYP